MPTNKLAKKKILTILMTGFVLLFVMLLLQTLAGKYGSMVYVPWVWFTLLYLPPIILLSRAANNDREVNISGLKIIGTMFVVASLLTICYQALAASMDDGPTYIAFVSTIKKSLFFLIPMEGFLMYTIWNVMISKNHDIQPLEPKVFISYNHNNQDVAVRIRDAIESIDVPVIMDIDDMQLSADIKTFIQNSIKESTIVVSIVSNLSLESAWVAKETTDALFLEAYMVGKKFIACYLDDDFFSNDYTLGVIEKTDLKIQEIQKLISRSHEKGIDTRDLNTQKSRLLVLRNNIDGIVGRLRDSLCLDIRRDEFDKNLERLLKEVKGEE